MSLVATVENGQIVESTSQSSLSSSSSTSSSSMDKESFLQLLVAQMKYQDPLEPTSNTEYISQYAQFSQVEEMQNMANSMDLQRASQLVGQEVYIKTTSSSGNTSYVQGKVDYVVYENSKAYLSINESLYSIDDLDTVVDGEYLTAYNKAQTFVNSINQLPNVNSVSDSDLEDIDELEETYNAMSDYEKTFVASDVVTSLNKYIEKAKEVRLAAENAKKNEEDADE
jgi:flagellar basal-body rod modification protein FlgD